MPSFNISVRRTPVNPPVLDDDVGRTSVRRVHIDKTSESFLMGR